MLALPDGTQLVAVGQPGSQIGATSGNVGAAVCAASLAAAAGKINYLQGLEFTFSGATAGSVVIATLVGLAGGTHSFIISVPAGATLPGQPLMIFLPVGAPASAVNTAITFSCPSLGAGNTNACVNISGYQNTF